MKFLDETGLAHLWSKIKSLIPTKLSQLSNDSGYIKSYTETDPTVPSHVKSITSANITSWNNKAEKSDIPTIPSIPTKTSQLTNDSGYVKVVNLATVADYEALGTYDSNTFYCVDEEG